MNKKNGISNFFFLRIILSSMLLTCILSCSRRTPFYDDSGSIFHTLYQIKYQSDNLLTDSIDAELRKFSLSLNPFNRNSIIARVNRNEDVEVDDWFIEVFNKAMDVSEQSDGAFDVTCAPLINLWGFGFRNSDSISQTAIDSILNFVGYRKIRLDGRRVIKDDPRLELNFSAIAKGFACDVIASLLERNGVQNYMVEIGGEIVVRGHNSRGQCWQIAINKPVDDDSGTNNGYADTIFLCSNSALATSGNYRNYHIRDGKKYSHTIDPKTGYPTENTLLSATIIATDCMSADAYATAFMALGYDKAMILAENIQEIDYILLVADENSKDGYRKIYKNEK